MIDKDNKNEITFWKVIHNKFLFKTIFNFIHSTEWVVYTETIQIRFDNRMKFKNTKELGLMAEHRQFQLLKCKLENNEYIKIDKRGIAKLFSAISSTTESSTLYQDIILLLLNKKRNQFEICDLTKMAIRCNSLLVFNILIGEPWNMKVYPSTLEFAIQYCNVETVKTLIDLQIKSYGGELVDDNLKKKSIQIASNNQNHREEMIEFILSNCKLCPTLKEQPSKIQFQSFQSLKSVELKNKILDWDMVLQNKDQTIQDETDIKYESLGLPFDELLLLYKIDKISNSKVIKMKKEFKKIKNNNTDGFNKSKEFQKKLILKKDLSISYFDYMVYHKETINESHSNRDYISENDGSDKSNLINLYRYVDELNLLSVHLLEYIEKLIKEVPINCIQILNNIEKRQDSKYPVFVINDKSTIEWLSKNNNPIINSLLKFLKGKIEFGSLELYILAISLFDKKTDLFFNKESSLASLFLNSIKSYDIDQLKTIQSLGIKLTGIKDKVNYVHQDVQQEEEERIIKLVQYLNENDYLNYSMDCFYSLFERISNVECSREIKLSLNVFSNKEITNLMIESILESKFKLLGFLLSNYNYPFTLSIEQVELIREQPKIIFNLFLDVYHCKEHIKPDEIIYIIQNLISNTNSTNKLSSSQIVILNYLIVILIKIKSTTIKQVMSVYQLINEKSIQIEHGFYHLFYLLFIRNPKLLKYILSVPKIIGLIHIGGDGEHYDCQFEGRGDSGSDNVLNFLKPDLFTYEFIFSSSFDEILNQLIYLLSISKEAIEEHSRNYVEYNDLLCFNLSYFIDIQRIDLFFKFYQQHIQPELHLSNASENYQPIDSSFPIITYQIDSPSTTIISTGSYFLNNQSTLNELYENQPPPQPISKQSFQKLVNGNYDFKPTKSIYSFSFESTRETGVSLLYNVLKTFTIDQVEKLIELNFFVYQFQYQILLESISICRFDIVDFIVSNFNIPMYSLGKLKFDYLNSEYYQNGITPTIIKDYINHFIFPNSYQDNQEKQLFQTLFLDLLTDKLIKTSSLTQIKLILNSKQELYKLFKLIKNEFQNIPGTKDSVNQLSDKEVLEFHALLLEIYKQNSFQLNVKSLLDGYFNHDEKGKQQKQQQQQQIYINQEDNLFLKNFIYGDIQICDFILNHFTNYKFIITKSSITKSIKNNQNIHIIKYYYKSLIKSSSTLKIHLRSELSNHKDYKFDLNWLN